MPSVAMAKSMTTERRTKKSVLSVAGVTNMAIALPTSTKIEFTI